MDPKNGGRCWQVVAIRRWSLAQVWLYLLLKHYEFEISTFQEITTEGVFFLINKFIYFKRSSWTFPNLANFHTFIVNIFKKCYNWINTQITCENEIFSSINVCIAREHLGLSQNLPMLSELALLLSERSERWLGNRLDSILTSARVQCWRKWKPENMNTNQRSSINDVTA